MEAISLQFPAWYLILCVLAGSGFALFLYLRDGTFRDHPAWVRMLMAGLRFLTVTAMSAMLLSPFLRLYSETIQQPVILIGQDNSESVGAEKTASDSAEYTQALSALVRSLEDRFDVHLYTFGDAVRKSDSITFREQVTDIAEFFLHAADHYADQNLGAVILATDGLFNRGRNPLYLPQKIMTPVYNIALGDTTVKADLLVSDVRHNRIAFLGDRFPVRIDIAGYRLAGRTATMTVERIEGAGRTEVARQAVRIDGDPFFLTEELSIEALHPGTNRYRVTLSGIAGEAVYANNVRDFYIEIIDSRTKILILAHTPHPDIAALQAVIAQNQNYSSEVKMLRDFDGVVGGYDLVIFHQLPSATGDIQRILRDMDAQQIPRIFVVGYQTQINRFNTVQRYLRIQGGRQSPNEVTAIADPAFALFTIPENLNAQIARFAPLYAPFGQYHVDPSAFVFLWQRIGRVETQYPLVLFGETANTKTAIIAAEGIWRWRLHDYLVNGSHALTYEILGKIIQYTTVKEDRRRFRVAPSKNLFLDNEAIVFTAELYNQSYELVNDPDVFLEVRDEVGREYHFTFNKTPDAYRIDIGRYPLGEYHFSAHTDYAGQRLQASGRFNVQGVQLESYVTTADHRLLYALSDKYGGDVFYPGHLEDLSQTILAHEQIRPVLYQSVSSHPLIHLRWLFFVFLVLLGVEWFVRRYLGGY